jgi:anti-sigma B factor antagonist
MVPAVELKVSSRSQGDHELVIATGEIDLYTAPRLQSELAAVIASAAPASRVIVDMSGVEFCDSTGMNVLLSCLRQVRERGGELELAAPRPAVRKILSVTGLDAVFTVQLSPGGTRRDTLVGALQAPSRLPEVFCGGHPHTPVPRCVRWRARWQKSPFYRARQCTQGFRAAPALTSGTCRL